MQIFDVIIFFELRTIQQKTVKPTYLCPSQAVPCPFPSSSFLAPNRQSGFNCVLLYCTELEKDDYIDNLHVLSCSVLLKSVLLISCVFWIFFLERWQSTLFQIFLTRGRKMTCVSCLAQHNFSKSD